MKKIKVVPFLAIILLSFTLSIQAYGTEKTEKKEKIERAAQQMFKEGNMNYVLAYAYNDGIIKDGQHYNWDFQDDVILFNGRHLQEPCHTKYVILSHKFESQCYRTGQRMYSMMVEDSILTIIWIQNQESEVYA
jgi:hypothetical protein